MSKDRQDWFGDNPEKDPGRELMKLLCNELIRRLTEAPEAMVASEFEVVRKLLGDSTVTLSQVRRGEFGKFAQQAAEEFPFEDDGSRKVVSINA